MKEKLTRSQLIARLAAEEPKWQQLLAAAKELLGAIPGNPSLHALNNLRKAVKDLE